MRTLARLERLSDRLSVWLLRLCAFVLMPIMVLVVCADVAARYLLNDPLGWAQDLTTLTLLLAFVAAIPLCTAQDGHIRVETLYERFGPTRKAIADLLGNLCGMLFMGMLAYRSLSDVPGMYKRGEGPELLNVPYWPVASFVGVCSVFIVVVFVLRSARAIASMQRPGPSDRPSSDER